MSNALFIVYSLYRSEDPIRVKRRNLSLNKKNLYSIIAILLNQKKIKFIYRNFIQIYILNMHLTVVVYISFFFECEIYVKVVTHLLIFEKGYIYL